MLLDYLDAKIFLILEIHVVLFTGTAITQNTPRIPVKLISLVSASIPKLFSHLLYQAVGLYAFIFK